MIHVYRHNGHYRFQENGFLLFSVSLADAQSIYAELSELFSDKMQAKNAMRDRIMAAILEAAAGEKGSINNVCISTDIDELLFPMARMSEGIIRVDESLSPDTIVVHKKEQ